MLNTDTTLSAKTQADGAQTVSLGVFDEAQLHQIHVSTSSTPAAGTLTVAIRTPGASTYITLSPTIDLTSPALFQFWGFADSIQLTPASFDGDKTYSVVITSGTTYP
jgi:hypothetical protein